MTITPVIFQQGSPLGRINIKNTISFSWKYSITIVLKFIKKLYIKNYDLTLSSSGFLVHKYFKISKTNGAYHLMLDAYLGVNWLHSR